MPTTNEAILDLQVRHQVGLQRLTAGTVAKLIPILNQSDADIVDKLRKRGATLEGSFTSTRLESLLAGIREINRDAHVRLGRDLRSDLKRLARYETGFQRDLLQRTVPVAFDMVMPTSEMLDAIVNSRPFQGKLLREWVSEMESGRFRRVRDAVRLGMTQGETTDQIVRRVRGTKARGYRDGVVEVNRRGAEAMIRTAVQHTANTARETLYAENDDLVKGVMIVATLDTDTCLTCQGYDKKVFPPGKGPRPIFHISCRCTTTPVLKSWRELGIDADEIPPSTRASMDGQVPATDSYGDWLRKQPPEVQNDALGPSRAKMFRTGAIDVERFTDTRGNHLTLDELRRREGDAFAAAAFAEEGAVYDAGHAGILARGVIDADEVKAQWVNDAPLQEIKPIIAGSQANQDMLTHVANQIAKEEGSKFENPGIKGEARILEKLEGRRPAALTDIVRGGFKVTSPGQSDAIVAKLGQQFQVADEGWNKTPAGYFDRKVLVRFPNGQIGEVQFWQPEMFQAKEFGGGHDLYVKFRALPAGDQEIAKLSAQMQDLYADVAAGLSEEWRAIVGKL